MITTSDATGQDLNNNVAPMLALPENTSVSVVATVGGALATIFNGLQSAGVDSVIMLRWSPEKDTWVGVSKAGGEPLR